MEARNKRKKTEAEKELMALVAMGLSPIGMIMPQLETMQQLRELTGASELPHQVFNELFDTSVTAQVIDDNRERLEDALKFYDGVLDIDPVLRQMSQGKIEQTLEMLKQAPKETPLDKKLTVVATQMMLNIVQHDINGLMELELAFGDIVKTMLVIRDNDGK